MSDGETLATVMPLGCCANLAEKKWEQRGEKARFQNIPTRRNRHFS